MSASLSVLATGGGAAPSCVSGPASPCAKVVDVVHNSWPAALRPLRSKAGAEQADAARLPGAGGRRGGVR